MKKIKSFTINEMLVVLLLTAIVVGLAFSILNLVKKQIGGISENYSEITRMQLLEQSLWVDLNSYREIYYNEKDREILFSHEIKTISYKIGVNEIVKESDTFLLKVASSQFYFNGKKVTSGKIDAIELELGKDNVSRPIFLYKKNDASIYVNNGF